MENSAKAKELLDLANLTEKDLPILFFEDGSNLVKPDLATIGNKVGLKSQAAEQLYDVVIIGAGPAGLAAGVYGASEGLKTLLIERRAPGGQAVPLPNRKLPGFPQRFKWSRTYPAGYFAGTAVWS